MNKWNLIRCCHPSSFAAKRDKPGQRHQDCTNPNPNDKWVMVHSHDPSIFRISFSYSGKKRMSKAKMQARLGGDHVADWEKPSFGIELRYFFSVLCDGYMSSKVFIIIPDACLLYTSPSPRDKRQSRMPSSA